YMRTDGVDVAEEALAAARRLIGADYGKSYVPPAPRQYQTKTKNAQEAHEAIRPTDVGRRPREMKSFFDHDQARLYELIWLRMVASQMESAELERTTADITAKAAGRVIDLRATGTVVKFDGFLTLYQGGEDDIVADEEGRRLPEMSAGESLAKRKIDASQHFTEPPPRYSEASLVKRMEELGIGRPSTYASILQVLKDRGYVRIEKKRLVPEDKGRVLTAFLESFFARYVEYDFTAGLEEQLDRISNNEMAWRDLLRDFWREFPAAVGDITESRVAQVIDALDEMLAPQLFPPRADGADPRKCPSCETGRLSLKLGKFGGFIGCTNYPECRYTRQLAPGNGVNGGPDGGMKKLGEDPASGREGTLRSARFGPYIQLGEATEGEKPKRASLPKGLSADDVDLDRALGLLSLPREIGKHPDDGEPIVAGVGRFGPYVQHGKTYANLTTGDDVLTVGLNRAVTLIEEKRAKRAHKGRRAADPGRALGDHPDKGGPIVVKNGRYGPYASHDGVNATLPSHLTPETITLEEAVGLIEARSARGGKKPAAAKPRSAAPKAKATAKPKAAAEPKPPAGPAPDSPRKSRPQCSEVGDQTCRVGIARSRFRQADVLRGRNAHAPSAWATSPGTSMRTVIVQQTILPTLRIRWPIAGRTPDWRKPSPVPISQPISEFCSRILFS